MGNDKMREARNSLVRIEKYLSTQPAEYCGYMDNYFSAELSSIEAALSQPSAQVPEGLEEFLKRIGVMLQPNGSLNVWSSRENRWVIARMAGELSDEYAMLTAAPSIAEKGYE